MLSKHAKTAFPSNEHKSKEILNIVHSEVCGPMSIACTMFPSLITSLAKLGSTS
jgi:hypothetical protein